MPNQPKLPCKTCPVFAICKNRGKIDCEILFLYIIDLKKKLLWRKQALEIFVLFERPIMVSFNDKKITVSFNFIKNGHYFWTT